MAADRHPDVPTGLGRLGHGVNRGRGAAIQFRAVEFERHDEIAGCRGAIVGWRTCDYYHQLENFDRYWDVFTEATHPWWEKGAHH